MTGMNEPTNLSTRDKLRDKLSETRENLADMGHLAKEAVHDKFQDLKGRAAEGYERGKEKVHEWEDSLVRTVRSSPMKSLLVAAGVGLAFGFLCRRG
jgi:ElaB/YqjD/DUF883 family membrane-anchored ribosome-binding protein